MNEISVEQELRREIGRLTKELDIRDAELDSIRSRLIMDYSDRKTPIVYSPEESGDWRDLETFHEALHTLALASRLRIGAHQSAISYVPDGNFKIAVHTHSFSEKYERYNSYDVMPTGKGVWGVIIDSRKPVRMTEAELYSHPQFKHFSGLKNAAGLEHPPLPGWLAVPVLRRDGGLIGVVQLGDKYDGDFNQDDEDQLMKLAQFYTPTFELQYMYEASQRLTEALREATQELQRSNAELEQFAYIASHDLQEPLRMVTSYLQLLERRYKASLDQNAFEFIGFAVDGASRMQTLIQDLLTYSRVGTKEATFAPSDCDAILDRVLSNLQVAISESAAHITRTPLPTVASDSSQIEQLLQNLIGNAIKFRGDGPPKIQIAAEAQPDHWLFSVQDNGIGIDPSHADRIFQVFQRLHGIGKYPGTGIGLAVCKKIVERHRGSIWVESKGGSGSTFFFTIPLNLNSYPNQITQQLDPTPPNSTQAPTLQLP